ncbi:MAG: M24 family metallopeptidase [Acidimicrobiia bacterium]|nr:M24 family metallopeptidase [Acidimicrobiia bacterium]MYF84646.1 M24 family metallopeptidase [Acidimicrobiia bacterium]
MDSLTLHAERRERLAASIGDGIALLPAGAETTRNHDVEHPFRQDSAFHYLTGFDEPDAVMLLDPRAADEQYVLFVRPKDREREIWTGLRAGTDGARERYGADASFPIGEFDTVLRKRLVGRKTVFLPFGNPGFHRRVLSLTRAVAGLGERYGRLVPSQFRDVSSLLGEMRLVKTPREIDLLRAACEITAEAHAEAMRFTRPGRFEYQVQAALEYVFRMRGARRDGYPSIVASGANACILHYTENDRRIADGDLVLIDAGAEYGYYSADITRTFPAAGRFTAPQRAVYELVLGAQQAALALARPGGSLKDQQEAASRVLTEGLVELGLLPGPARDAIPMHHYREFFMHGTGHWLGIDVHDAGAYRVGGTPRPLEPGMVFTVEPGIYVDPEREAVELAMLEFDIDEQMERRMLLGPAKARELEKKERDEAPKVVHPIPEEFRGIGIRIEDDVLITGSGHEILTRDVPTDPDRIENLCAETPLMPFFEPYRPAATGG